MFSDLLVNAQFAFPRIPNYLKFKNLTILTPFHSLAIDHKHYTVKIATSTDELAQVLKLRFEVFFQEFATRKIQLPFFPYDIDSHDFNCDHLIVKDKEDDKVVAVYRLLHSDACAGKFYSENEFDLTAIHQLPGKKVELGRACVHKEYRNGTVIGLLWKGLIEYAKKTDAHYLFGCSSIGRKDFGSFKNIMSELQRKDALLSENYIKPVGAYDLNSYPDIEQSLLAQEKNGLSSLMHMYVMAGAKMGMNPAYDEEMDCLDLFTLINVKHLPSHFERRFSC